MSARLLAAFAAVWLLAGVPAMAAVPGAIQEAVAACGSGLEDGAKEIADAIAVEAAIRAGLNKPPPGAPPASEGAVAAATLEVQESKELLTAAAALQQQARAKLESVAAASNPAEAQVRLREAQDMVGLARNMTRRAKTILHPSADAGFSGAQPASIRLGSENSALAQLIRAGRLGVAAQGRSAFYESRDATGWDESAAVVTVPGGGQVGVRSLLASFRSTIGPNVPLFVPVPSPAGGSTLNYRLSPQGVTATRDPEKRAELQRVGGVDLQVTLDLLEFHGLTDFRKPGPALIVEQPVLISVAALAAAARPYANDWNALPEPLRFPGAVERIVGFVLDPARGDIFLVGVPARRAARRIDIDALIVGLRSVWRDGLSPAVSLDPMPDAPGGPQYARVIGVPESSGFARIMLDADYAMKRIMAGAQRSSVPGYENLLQMLATSSDAPLERNRFWFFPTPLGAGDLQVSATARTVLFNAGLKVLTEGERLAVQGFVGTGSANRVASRAAESFTDALDALERSDEVSPPDVFAALHGLVDIVTLCSIWRKAGIDSPLLHSLAALPVRKREGAQALPKFYPGVNTSITVKNRVTTLSGGVHVRVRATQRALDRFRDRTTTALEAAAATFPRGGTLAQPLELRMTLPRAGSGGRGTEYAMATAEAALAVGDYAQARARFREVTQADPLNADAWAALAQTQAQFGEHANARASMARARALEPVDEELRVLALDIELRGNPKLVLSSQEPRTRRALAEDYVMQAVAALSAGSDSGARQRCDTALALDAANPDAYYIRALTFEEPGRAIPDLQRAVERYRLRFQKSEADADGFNLARTIGLLASVGAAQAIKAPDGATTLQQLLADLQEARRLDPLDPALLATEVKLRLGLEMRQRMQGQPANTDYLLEQAERLVRRHPDFPAAHQMQALAYRIAGRSGDAVVSLSAALKQDPTFAQAYADRAALYAELGLCTRARADAAEARKWKVRGSDDLERQLAKCPA